MLSPTTNKVNKILLLVICLTLASCAGSENVMNPTPYQPGMSNLQRSLYK